MKRVRLALNYLLGSRLFEYREILAAALKEAYTVCSVEQSLTELASRNESLFVLRHDVDRVSPGVRAMAALEAELGVTSTYYFRLETIIQRDVDYAKSLGHEVSFHYETLSDYAAENDIADRVKLLSEDALSRCAVRFRRDLTRFRSELGVPCRTVAAHGTPLNRTLNVPNSALFEHMPQLSGELGISLEAYDRSYLRNFDCYISDTQWEINDGFRYGIHPLAAISRGISRIMMLSHPNHWAFSPRTRARRIVKCFLLGRQSDDASFAQADRLRGQ